MRNANESQYIIIMFQIMFPNPSDEIAYLSNMDTNANVLEHDYFK